MLRGDGADGSGVQLSGFVKTAHGAQSRLSPAPYAPHAAAGGEMTSCTPGKRGNAGNRRAGTKSCKSHSSIRGPQTPPPCRPAQRRGGASSCAPKDPAPSPLRDARGWCAVMAAAAACGPSTLLMRLERRYLWCNRRVATARYLGRSAWGGAHGAGRCTQPSTCGPAAALHVMQRLPAHGAGGKPKPTDKDGSTNQVPRAQTHRQVHSQRCN